MRRLKFKLRKLRHRWFDNFIFIHINKTGGSSFENALHIPHEHKTVSEKIDELGQKNWDRKFSFTIVRNPFDRVVSHYSYRVQTSQAGLDIEKLPFIDWVRLTLDEQHPSYYDNPKMFMPQYQWISDSRGNILVDEICRFEQLADDFGHICEKLGKGNTMLPHVRASERKNYKHYYDDSTLNIVANWFSKDIELFDYQF